MQYLWMEKVCDLFVSPAHQLGELFSSFLCTEQLHRSLLEWVVCLGSLYCCSFSVNGLIPDRFSFRIELYIIQDLLFHQWRQAVLAAKQDKSMILPTPMFNRRDTVLMLERSVFLSPNKMLLMKTKCFISVSSLPNFLACLWTVDRLHCSFGRAVAFLLQPCHVP